MLLKHTIICIVHMLYIYIYIYMYIYMFNICTLRAYMSIYVYMRVCLRSHWYRKEM